MDAVRAARMPTGSRRDGARSACRDLRAADAARERVERGEDPVLIAAVRCKTFEQSSPCSICRSSRLRSSTSRSPRRSPRSKRSSSAASSAATRFVRYTNAVVTPTRHPRSAKTPAEIVRLNPTFARKPLLAHLPDALHAAIKAHLDAKRGREAEADDTAEEADRLVRKMGPRFRKLGARPDRARSRRSPGFFRRPPST